MPAWLFTRLSAPLAGAACAMMVLLSTPAEAAKSCGSARWSGLAERQRGEIDDAERQAAAYGCRSARSASVCRMLSSTIRRMEANLGRLERLGAGDGCRAAKIEARPTRQRLAGRAERAKRSSSRADRTERPAEDAPALTGLSAAAGPIPAGFTTGLYRTLCVRPCDGYFFPISFSTTADRFAADQTACEARCPGMQAALYVHPVPQEDVETMVSLARTPYRDLQSAFLYKLKGVERTKTCGCRAASPEPRPDALRTPQAEPETAPVLSVAVPTPRPDPPLAVALREPGGRKAGVRRPMRVVGPAFYPDL